MVLGVLEVSVQAKTQESAHSGVFHEGISDRSLNAAYIV